MATDLLIVRTDGQTESDESDVSSDLEPLYPSTTNPSEVDDTDSIVAFPPGKQYQDSREIQQVGSAMGKWMIFRPFTQIDETWHMIRKEIEIGLLAEKALAALSTTLFYQPSAHGPGPRVSRVILVYTTEEDADEIGYILIGLVKHDIKYKTEKATNNREYAWRSTNKPVCLKTLYWNHGRPSFALMGEQCRGPDCRPHKVKDIWHINYVTAPKFIISTAAIYGRWVIAPELCEELTSLWHFLREVIEEGKLGPVEMVCPPKRNRNDENEEAVFLVYTARENKEKVGLILAVLVGRDIIIIPDNSMIVHRVPM